MIIPKAVLFDLGDTVLMEDHVDPRAGTARVLALSHNPRGVTVDEIQERAARLNTDIDKRRQDSWLEVSINAFQRLIYDPLGITFDISLNEVAWEFWRGTVTMSPAPCVRELLELLCSRGISTAIVSNTVFSEDVLKRELAQHGLLNYFTFVMASADYGLRKPHPELFRVALERLHVAPEDAWFIGNSLECDVAGARNADIKSMWYNPCDAAFDGIEPDMNVRSYADLIELFE